MASLTRRFRFVPAKVLFIDLYAGQTRRASRIKSCSLTGWKLKIRWQLLVIIHRSFFSSNCQLCCQFLLVNLCGWINPTRYKAGLWTRWCPMSLPSRKVSYESIGREETSCVATSNRLSQITVNSIKNSSKSSRFPQTESVILVTHPSSICKTTSSWKN